MSSIENLTKNKPFDREFVLNRLTEIIPDPEGHSLDLAYCLFFATINQLYLNQSQSENSIDVESLVHRIVHSDWVANHCAQIINSTPEPLDYSVLEAGAIIHDIGTLWEDFLTSPNGLHEGIDGFNHMELGYAMFEEFICILKGIPIEKPVFFSQLTEYSKFNDLFNRAHKEIFEIFGDRGIDLLSRIIYGHGQKDCEDKDPHILMIRDADKIDGWKIFCEVGFLLMEQQMFGNINPDVKQVMLKGDLVGNGQVKTYADTVVRQLAMLSDINFAAARDIVFEEQIPIKLLALLKFFDVSNAEVIEIARGMIKVWNDKYPNQPISEITFVQLIDFFQNQIAPNWLELVSDFYKDWKK